MNSSFFFLLLLLLLLSISFPTPSSAIRPKTQQITEQASTNHQRMLGGGRYYVQRKVLHEVHSGPNPIGNSIPQNQKKWKSSKARTNP